LLSEVSVVKKQTFSQIPPLAEVIQQIPTDKGTYALIYRCDALFRTNAGKLGPVFFSIGHWIYIGSAFGPGGLKARLGHHLKPSPHPHWHLDYVKHALTPVEIWLTTDAVKHEHAWAGDLSRLRGATCPIAGFGASDCACRAHLIYLRRRPGFNGFKKRIGTSINGRLTRLPIDVHLF
jgi:Uri superfamily endonuclease